MVDLRGGYLNKHGSSNFIANDSNGNLMVDQPAVDAVKPFMSNSDKVQRTLV
jgi:hypothetical protein